jgi:hypothetical protein
MPSNRLDIQQIGLISSPTPALPSSH